MSATHELARATTGPAATWRSRAAVVLGLALLVCAAAPLHAQQRAAIHVALIEGLSGPFGPTGEAAWRNLVWATERVNARGGVKLADGQHPLAADRYDTRGDTGEALSALRAAIGAGVHVVMQGNSSAIAAALVNAIDRNNERNPSQRVLLLNYAAIDPVLTNARCSFWHFRFDAHADMRMTALIDQLRGDQSVKRVYLIAQDTSFGRIVALEARRQIVEKRPDVEIVGEQFHPLGRIRDFSPYAAKIVASRADAVVTGNWGDDLTLLVKAANAAGYRGRFYTFYGNALGAPGAFGEAGVGRVFTSVDWLPNVPTPEAAAFYRAFRKRFPNPADDYPHMRIQLAVEALAQALERARSDDPQKVAKALESADVTVGGQHATMRAADHQLQQPLVVGVLDRQGAPGVPFDVEGSGFGFRVVRQLSAAEAERPSTCHL